MDRLNQDAQIVTQDFAQGFVDLRRQALTSQPLAELQFQTERRAFEDLLPPPPALSPLDQLSSSNLVRSKSKKKITPGEIKVSDAMAK